MSNYGTNIGNDNTFEGPTSIKNKTTIKKKSNIAISVAIGTIVVIVIIFIFLHSPKNIILLVYGQQLMESRLNSCQMELCKRAIIILVYMQIPMK